MTSYTTQEIKKLAKDTDALIALMNYYKVTNLMSISEPMALDFLNKVKNNEIEIKELVY
jgi:hypothetical protein